MLNGYPDFIKKKLFMAKHLEITKRLIFAIIFVSSILVMPVFAQTLLPAPPSSSTVKDYFSTLFNKLKSSTQQTGNGNPQISNVTDEAEKAVVSAVDLFSAVEYLFAALVGLVAVKIFGNNVPNFIIPLFFWIMIGLTAYGVLKHIWKLVVVGIIVIVAIFMLVLFGSNFLPA